MRNQVDVQKIAQEIDNLASHSGDTEMAARLREASRTFVLRGMPNLSPVLPSYFSLRGKPFTIADHFMFEPMYATLLPQHSVWVTGRQVSKCLPLSDDPAIWLANGRVVGTSAVKVGDRVISLGLDGRRRLRKVLGVYRTGKQMVYRVRTRRGAELLHTAQHRVRTLLGYTPVRELKPGSRVAGARLGGIFGTQQVGEDRIILTACMIGDGCCGLSLNFSVTSSCKAVIGACYRIANKHQRISATINVCAENEDGLVTHSVHLSQDVRTLPVQWMKADNNWGHYSWEKTIPDWVFSLPRPGLRLFLSWLWATDGSLIPRGNNISYSTTSRIMAKQIKSLMAKFCIPVTIHQREAYCDGKRGHDAYIIRVETREGWQRFMEQFDVPGKPAFELPTTVENNNRDTIPIEVQSLLTAAYRPCESRGQKGRSLHACGLRARLKCAPQRSKLQKYVAYLGKQEVEPSPALAQLRSLLLEDVIWDEVVSVEKVGRRETVDFEVEEDHNFIYDGVYTHNSTNQAASVILTANSIPYFDTLCITPQYEMTRRFSNNYLKALLEQSPVKHLWSDQKTVNNVLQRGFRNGSNVYLTFAYLDVERARGLAVSRCILDEAQGMDEQFVPVFRECLSFHPWKLMQFTGTPLGMSNLMFKLWNRSSQAEWCIPCFNCKRENVPSMDHDLDAMIGPDRDDISDANPAVICAGARCRRPINPRKGYWKHRNPQLRDDFVGYHVPQIILPAHYGNRDSWRLLLGKQKGAFNTTTAQFYNEVCGESYDTGSRLVTLAELKAACVLHENTIENGLAVRHEYIRRILSVDWGGGGIDETSFTTYAVLGERSDGTIDVIFGYRSLTPGDYIREAKITIDLLTRFECDLLVHDFGGAGALREQYIINAGWPLSHVVPVALVRQSAMMRHVPPDKRINRSRWHLDKPRSLALTCHQIKLGTLRFFAYDNTGTGEQGLVEDFLALVEEKSDVRFGSDSFTIVRQEGQTDDFAQAVNIGCCTIWHTRQRWPNLAMTDKYVTTQEFADLVAPMNPDWDASDY